MRQILLCTKNKGKVKEFIELFNLFNVDVEVISLFNLKDDEEVEENGNSFKENAFLKANHYYKKYHLPTISDDSGLCIDHLNGAPGINSARFSGAGPKENIKKVLRLLDGITTRSAYFTCTICYIDEDGQDHYFEGRVNGSIATFESGENGFGYDPIFLVNHRGNVVSMASLAEDEKNKISHRYNAFIKFIEYLKANL